MFSVTSVFKICAEDNQNASMLVQRGIRTGGVLCMTRRMRDSVRYQRREANEELLLDVQSLLTLKVNHASSTATQIRFKRLNNAKLLCFVRADTVQLVAFHETIEEISLSI
jgi:hypothetical protein